MNSATTPHNNTPHLRDYINVILRRRRLVLCIMALALIGALYVMLTTSPVYQAAATLRVQAPAQGGQGGGPIGDPIGDAFGMRRVMELDTELQILKSRSLAEVAVRHLHYQFQLTPSNNGLSTLYHRVKVWFPWLVDFYGQARAWLPWSVAFSRLSLLRQPAFSIQEVEVGDIPAPESYNIAILEGGKFVIRTAQNKREIGQGQIGHSFRSEHFAFLLQSQKLQPGDTIAFTLLPFWQATAQFQRNITVSLRRKTEIMEVSAQAKFPQLACDMALALARAYIAFVLQQKTQEASQILEFVDRQLSATQTQLDASAGNLGRFKEQKGFVTLSGEAQATLEKITKFDTSLQEIQSTIKEAEDLRRRLQTGSTSPDSRTIYAVGSGVGSQVLISLADRLATQQVTLNTVRGQYTPRHPAVLQAEQQVQSIKEKIAEQLATLITNLRSRAVALQDVIREYEKQLEKLPKAELELAKLTRQTTVNEELYSFLLKKREETRIVRASTVSNVQIIDPPLVPTRSINVGKGQTVLTAVLLGLLLGVCLAFAVEYFDDSIKMVEDAEQQLRLPLLGAIPEMPTNGSGEHGRSAVLPLVAQQKGHGFAVAEGFRSLRTSIQLLDVEDKQRKKLAITSPQVGDGKSTVASNLALFLGVIGCKTLLVDADLRRPRLARLFNVARKPGLTEVLSGEFPWPETIHPVGDNLHLLTSGELPLSPAELLASRRMRELLGEWEAVYDYILFDTPPVLAVTDPVTVGGLCQGVLLVLHASVTSVRIVKRAEAIMEMAHVPIVGIVLNGLKIARGYGYHYDYGYRYNYGYGYGYGYGSHSENGQTRDRQSHEHPKSLDPTLPA